jgi:hypothetical protein
MQAMGSVDFFVCLAGLMTDNPPTAAAAPMLRKLKRLGLQPGQPPQ